MRHRPPFRRPGANLIRLAALLYQPLDRPPIAERKPVDQLDLAVEPAEPKDVNTFSK